MSRSRFRSSTSLVAAAAVALAAAGCGDDGDPGTCGPGDAPADGIMLSGAEHTVAYGSFSASHNGDCGSRELSLTISATQVGGTGLLTLCVPRPDLITGPATIGADLDQAAAVWVIDVQGESTGCAVRNDGAGPAPQGSATFEGLCDQGKSPAGFALQVAAQIAVTITCGDAVDQASLQLSGRVAVTAAD